MATLNKVFLYGIVAVEPKVYYKKGDRSVPFRGDLVVNVIKRLSDAPGIENVLNESFPSVIAFNPERISELSKLRKGDFVEIRGVFTVRTGDKSIKCPHCEKLNTIKNSATGYVTPLSIEKRYDEKNTDKDMRNAVALKPHHEISNLILALGAVSKAVNYYHDSEAHIETAAYPIGVNRQLFIPEDDPAIKTDYMWVKRFGQQAREDKESLKLGDMVLVNGSLSTRIADKMQTCEHCSGIFAWKDKITEISPYSVEYLFNNREKDIFSGGGDILTSDGFPEIPYDLSSDEKAEDDDDIGDIDDYFGQPGGEDSLAGNDDITDFLKDILNLKK